MSVANIRQGINKGRPALVCVRTKEKIIIQGRPYTVLKMFYHTKGDYMPYAQTMF